MILGVDLHSGYGKIDFQRVAAAGVRFAIIKCTEGNEGKDGRFDEYVAGCKSVGIYCGAYLFGFPLPTDPAHPGRSAKDQARKLYADARGLGKGYGELPPVLDLEWPPSHEKVKGTSQIVNTWDKWQVTARSICDWGLECLGEMAKLWGRTPMIYTYPWFWRTLGTWGRDETWGHYPLWIASGGALNDWLPAPGVRPDVPAPWTTWTIWQHGFEGSSIRIPGIQACPVDRDVFNGSIDELRELANVDSEAVTERELPSDDDTKEVAVPEPRPSPFGKVFTNIEFPVRKYPNGPGEPPDDAA